MDLGSVSEYFEILVDAPERIKGIRALLINLALRGRLGTQRIQDQPVSQLLLKYSSDRRSQPPSFSSNHAESPCLLPKTWAWIKFGDVFDIQGGTQPPKSQFKDKPSPGYVRLLQIRDLGERPVPTYVKSESVRTFCTEQDVMLGRYGASVGKIFIGQNGAYNVALTKIIFDHSAFSQRWVYFLLQSDFFQARLADASRSAQAGFNKGDLADIWLPLCPAQEQHRIVAKIDELMQLCDELEQKQGEVKKSRCKLNTATLSKLVLAQGAAEFQHSWKELYTNFEELYSDHRNLDPLKNALTDLAVTGRLIPNLMVDETGTDLLRKIALQKSSDKKVEPALPFFDDTSGFPLLPSTWAWAPLKVLITFGPKNGYSPKAVDFPTAVKSLTLSATTAGKFNPIHSKYIDESILKDSHLWLNDGDVLFQRGNSMEYVGVSAVYRGADHEFIYPDLMMKVRFSEQLSLDYILLVLNSNLCRQYLRDRASGTSSSMPKINQEALCGLPIPIPPYKEQLQIVQHLQKLLSLSEELELTILQKESKASKVASAFERVLVDNHSVNSIHSTPPQAKFNAMGDLLQTTRGSL